MSEYRDMMKLACWVAQSGMDEWKKEEIEYMVEECGAEAVEDFYKFYGNKFGIYVDEQLKYIKERE